MATKKSKAKKKAGKQVSRRGPLAVTRRTGRGGAGSGAAAGGAGGIAFSAPLLPMPQSPVYPPRDYEEAATLVVGAYRDMEDVLPRLGLTPDQMEEMLGHSAALQQDEERLARALAKAGGARVAYDDKVWRVCLKIHELARTMADDHPDLAERFAFLAEFIKARLKGATKGPPGTPAPE